MTVIFPPRFSPVSCSAYRGPEKTLESSNFMVFNPSCQPGCVVMAGSTAAHESIGSQVACRLALEHFSTALLDCFDGEECAMQEGFGLHVLESAFRDANRNVYSFGHSLAAGGRTSAVFVALLLVQDDEGNGSCCVGRVGDGAAFLLRDGELFPFFGASSSNAGGGLGNYLGANSLVAVDLANVPVEAGDSVYLFSEPLDVMGESELLALATDMQEENQNPAEHLSRFLFASPQSVGFSFSLSIGSPSIFLPASSKITLSDSSICD